MTGHFIVFTRVIQVFFISNNCFHVVTFVSSNIYYAIIDLLTFIDKGQHLVGLPET